MSRILIAFATNSGSTADIARAIGDELAKNGDQVDVRPLDEVSSVDGYQSVVVGAPMIFGWHGAARAFVHKHEHALSRMTVSYFLTAMSLTQTADRQVDAVPVSVDPALAKAPKNAGRLGFRESYATVANYVRPALKAAPQVKPASVAVFGGKLELFRLKLWQMLFVMLVIRAQPGDYRNWPFIRAWAHDVSASAKTGAA